MKFKGGETVFYSMEIITKAVNVTEDNVEKVGGDTEKALKSRARKWVRSKRILSYPP